MAILRVYKYPHPVLRKKCEPVTVWDDTIKTLIRDMVQTMYAHPGAVGLAAPQVGVPVRIVVMDTAAKTTKDQLMILVNPVIVQASRNKMVREGCLSFPEYLANIKRAQRITVEYRDENGEEREFQAEGLEAIAVQHELDHLEGVLLIDRVNSLKTDLIRRRPVLPAESGQTASPTEA